MAEFALLVAIIRRYRIVWLIKHTEDIKSGDLVQLGCVHNLSHQCSVLHACSHRSEHCSFQDRTVSLAYGWPINVAS